MKLIMKAYNNDDYWCVDYCVLNFTDDLKERIKKIKEFTEQYKGEGYINITIYGVDFSFHEMDESPQTILDWFETKDQPDQFIEIGEEQLPTHELRQDTFAVKVSNAGITLHSYGKYDSSIEFYTDTIFFETLNL